MADINLTPEHKKFLDDTRPYRETLINTGTVTDMNLIGMLYVYRQYWDPSFLLDINVGIDVIRFIKLLHAKYDEYLATLPPPVKKKKLVKVRKRTNQQQQNP